jgi:peptidoglycan/LPS O-acetylase OafA/YrhL
LLPGLGLSLVLTVLGGLFVTSVPPQQYFSGETLRFLFLNFSLLTPAYYLTGVECGTGLCNMNGSLWTLPWEARCYVVLALLGALGLARPTLIARFLLPATLVGVLVWDIPVVQSAVTAFVGEGPAYLINMFDRLWALFALGIAAYVFRDRIKLSWLWLGLLFGINLAAHAAGLGLHVRAIFIGYAVLCFGFLTARERAISAEWPDYSYGMYIFAFPVMLAAQALVATSSHHLLALINLLVTLPLAALSWHLVEKPALDAFRRSRSRMVPTPLLHP